MNIRDYLEEICINLASFLRGVQSVGKMVVKKERDEKNHAKLHLRRKMTIPYGVKDYDFLWMHKKRNIDPPAEAAF